MTQDNTLSLADRLPALPRRVLVVDDSRAQRRILTVQLQRWGYEVIEADSGEAALDCCRAQGFDIILSDWVMPGMSGLELCRAFRALPREGYGYFILLTSKSEKAEVAVGLENGADDFLAKPVNSEELRARLRVGERIVGMQKELVQKNRLIGTTLDQLQKVYDSLDRDLIEARKLQQSLMMDRQRDFGTCRASALFRPSGHVGGDLVGSFQINPRHVAIYSVDVSGHGVASAMMTARLAGLLSGSSPDQDGALSANAEPQDEVVPPDLVADRLNRVMIDHLKVDQYFTMVYAEVDLVTGLCHLVQAGHPHPVLMRAAGEVEVLGQGGLPVGLIPQARYDRVAVQLLPGDRLVLCSDGITECPDVSGAELGQDGLVRLLVHSRALASPDLLEALCWDLATHAGGGNFPDDVSALVFDYHAPA
jgi:sigma-B regulation protein RsbU (phosphoserine phosphatase)